MINTDTTITDKENFSVSIIDKEKFSKLNQEQKQYFEILRNSILEIFPTIEDKSKYYDEISLKFAENFAHIALKTFDLQFEKINTKFIELEETINNLRN